VKQVEQLREAKATTLKRVRLARSCAMGGNDVVGPAAFAAAAATRASVIQGTICVGAVLSLQNDKTAVSGGAAGGETGGVHQSYINMSLRGGGSLARTNLLLY